MMASLQLRRGGFTLIETLVAILILALGLLGMLGLIINSLKLSSSSNYRTVAGQQAYAMAETLRGNPTLLTSSTAGLEVFSNPTSAIIASCRVGGACTRNNFVQTEFGIWQEQLAQLLPLGRGTVCRDGDPAGHLPTSTAGAISNWNCSNGVTNTDQFVVKICWDESRIAASTQGITATQAAGSTGSFLCTWTSL